MTKNIERQMHTFKHHVFLLFFSGLRPHFLYFHVLIFYLYNTCLSLNFLSLTQNPTKEERCPFNVETLWSTKYRIGTGVAEEVAFTGCECNKVAHKLA
jgi:hypothetical protein